MNTEFSRWEVQMEKEFTQVKSTILRPPMVLKSTKGEANWIDYERGILNNTEPIKLIKNKWALVYCAADEGITNVLVDMFADAAKRLGVVVEDPLYVTLANINGWKKAIETSVKPAAINVIVVVLAKKEQKKPIKAFLDGFGVPSQFVLTNTINRAAYPKDGKVKITVFSNILKQMNAKVALDIYRIKFPLKTAMVVGVDVVNKGTESYLGFTASYSKFLTKFYSKVERQQLRKDLIKQTRPDGRNGKDV
jgi:P2-related tail formation protein